MIKQYLFIKKIPSKGRGVFTKESIVAGTLIEEAPVIVMTAQDRLHLDKTLLHDYIFEWGTDKARCCVALGLISIYNHSYKSNCEYFMDFETEMIEIKTVRPVQKGEELTINYHGDWNDHKKIWFDAV
ncbi:MAG: SET domain-containing protein [Bacteroidota bacterium]|nr:SET domain-containing protein [Bacteroidota bacterium]